MDTVESAPVAEEESVDITVSDDDQPVTKSCRLCCNEEQQSLSLLFPEGTHLDASKLLLKKIFECTTVQITNEGDDQNALICEPCVAKIDDFYEYREQCKANDDRIRQNAPTQLLIKQEKDLQLHQEPDSAPSSILHHHHQDSVQLDEPATSQPSSTRTATAHNEHAIEEDSCDKDTEDSLLQPMQPRTVKKSFHSGQNTHSEEITIKREAFTEDDDVFYNSDGEAVSAQEAAKHRYHDGDQTGKKQKYFVMMNSNNRERLVYNRYMYCRHFSRRDGSIHWRCRLGGCQAAVNLYTDGTIVHANDNLHTHPPNGPDEPPEENSMLAYNGDRTGEDSMEMDDMYEPYTDEDTMHTDDLDLVPVEADSLRIVINKKKGETLVHRGFKYCRRHARNDGSVYWKCRSNNNKCHAGIYVYPNSMVKYSGSHNHEKVVDENQHFENDADNTMDEDIRQNFTIIEDVDDDDEEEEDDGDMSLLAPGTEVKTSSGKVRGNFEITTNVKGRECLIYEGHQYSKDRERSDGAVLWRCRRNYDKCRSIAIVYPDGMVEKCGEHFHETDKRYMERREQGMGSRLYRITKNQRGNDALVFEGHRFSKEWSRVDGSIIWRCSYKSGICRIKVVLNAAGIVYRMGSEHDHNHETTEEQVTEEFTERDRGESEANDDSLLTPARHQPRVTPVSTPQPQLSAFVYSPELQAAGNYKIIKNRKGFEALVHDGYRYCKVRTKQDGSVRWLCKMNKKTCRASVDLYPDGSVIRANEFDHNHGRPTDMDTVEIEEEEEPQITQEVTYPIDPEVFGSSQWYYVKNFKNGISMMHAGYRYTKKCDRVDGTSLWRCSASQRGCKAGVILFPNETLAMVENAEHSHKPYETVRGAADTEIDPEVKPYKNTADVSDRDLANDSDMTSLLHTVLGGEDVNWMGGDTENESVWYNSATDRPYPRPSSGPPNFKIIKNRRNTDSLVHRGYRYCKIRDRVDGSILWQCQMNKKTCKASVNLSVEGRVEVINGYHNHEKTDEDNINEDEVEQFMPNDESSSDLELTLEELPEKPETPELTKPSEHQIRVPIAKHPDYYYITNKKNGLGLIHKGFRFNKSSERPDGTSVWRCSMGGGTCMSRVTICADGTPVENSVKHIHPPLADLPPELELEPDQIMHPEEPEDVKPPYEIKGDLLEWEGFHYRKMKELPDSCIIWVCQVDSCRVAVKMLPDSRLKMLSESEHNHTAPGQLPSNTLSLAAVKPAATTPGGKPRTYRLFKNQRGQMTMLYKGYRYSVRNRNQDGTSSWKCRSNSKCRAVIYLMQDDRVVPGNHDHNHDPNWESTNKLEAVAAPTRVNPLYDYLNIIPGGKSKPSEPPSTEDSAPERETNPTSYGRNVIQHKGFYYRLVVRKKNGREYWRCVHFRVRACRAALFCRDNGAIVTSSNGKEHSHAGGAAARPLPPQHAPSLMAQSRQKEPQKFNAAAQQITAPSPSDFQLTDGDQERYIDHGEYVIAKNRKDQNTLIYKDRRYYLSYNRSDGSGVWRCAHRKRYKCYAYVRLRADGRLLSTGEQAHSHSLTGDAVPAAATSNSSPVMPTKNYKIVKNRVGNDILIHDSHRFRLNYQKNDGTTHWRCIWARSNHCSASVYLHSNGVLKNAAAEAEIIHNHPPPSQVKKALATNAGGPQAQPSQQPHPVQLHSAARLSQVQTQSQVRATDPSRTIPEEEGISDYTFAEEGSKKVLLCRNYQYYYGYIQRDGNILYRCKEQKKLQCPMGVVLLSNGKLRRANAEYHNHDAIKSEPQEDDQQLLQPMQNNLSMEGTDVSQQEEWIEQYPPLNIPANGDPDFKVVKTTRGESLIYKGYRYWAKNRLANGIVSLCCTRKKTRKCPAVLRLLTTGRVIDPTGLGHTHPPNLEGTNPGDQILQPSASHIIPKPIPTPVPVGVGEPTLVRVAPHRMPAQLPALSFNEESDDDAEDGDESIIGSRRYVFMKSTSQRNFIVFEGFVYDFEHKQHDGCVFYRCKTNETCPASLMLLTNGRVMNIDDSLHVHEKPDLSALRPVGRGSKEFRIVQNKNGSNILVHRGHRYTTPRAKTDGAGIWYCHTFVPSINRRCYVPIELLPNGRVAPVGEKQHNHAAPFKTKHDSSDTKEKLSPVKVEHSNGVGEPEVKSDNRMLLLGGHRYSYSHQRDDGAILWKCVRKSCNASMYRLTDGQVVKGPEHNHEKIETSNKRRFSDIDSKPNYTSSPIAKGGLTYVPTKAPKKESSATRFNPYIGQSLINNGYRYTYYLTRRDGSEHWRCCRRISLRCRGGLFKYQDGTLVPSNDEGHSHDQDHLDYNDSIPLSYSIQEADEPEEDETEEQQGAQEPDEHEESSTREQTDLVEEDGTYEYEMIGVKGKKKPQLLHKGALFIYVHTRRDRARYYRCKTAGCRVAFLLHRNGLLVRANRKQPSHDCQHKVKAKEEEEEREPELDEEHEEEEIEEPPQVVVQEEVEDEEEEEEQEEETEHQEAGGHFDKEPVIEDDIQTAEGEEDEEIVPENDEQHAAEQVLENDEESPDNGPENKKQRFEVDDEEDEEIDEDVDNDDTAFQEPVVEQCTEEPEVAENDDSADPMVVQVKEEPTDVH